MTESNINLAVADRHVQTGASAYTGRCTTAKKYIMVKCHSGDQV
jgi:hypothetical protein